MDRIRVPKSREAIFGTLVHDTLKFMFRSDPLFPTLDEVVAHFRAHWPASEIFNRESAHDPRRRAWSEDDEKAYFEEGVRMLKKFYEKNAPWNFHIIDLESRFEIALLDEKTGETHILTGIIDRIDKPADNAYEIIDYKTAKRMPSQDTLDQNLQLSLYSLGLQKRWPDLAPEDIKTSLYFLKHSEKLSAHVTQEAMERTKRHILSTIAQIQSRLRSGKEFEPMPSPLCDWCGYRPLCPAWKHLYKTSDTLSITNDSIQNVIQEYFELKKTGQQNDARLKELQAHVTSYMDKEGVTRVFGDAGSISKKIQQRYTYDMERVKEVLSPLGKWEEVLKADEIKLRKILREIPEAARHTIKEARSVSKEYIVLTSSTKSLKKKDD